ncbi:hypothetical protein Tco_0233166, partial [Tanacetum coccineum]
MGTKNTSSSGSVLEEPEIQKLQIQAKIFKENSLNKLNALKSTTQLLEQQSILYQQAFAQLFGDSLRTFKFQLSQHMNNLETLLNAETLHEMDSKSALSVIKLQFESALDDVEKVGKDSCVNQYWARFKRFNHRFTSSGDEISSGIHVLMVQPLAEQVQNHDENDVFANVRRHSEQPESINDTYVLEKDDSNVTPDSSNICNNDNQNKQNELEKYIAFNDRTIDYDILQTKLNETLGLLALKDIEIKEGLKTKAYEISVLNQKHDELVKKSLLTKSQLEGHLKEKTKVISDLKVKEEKDIDKMIEMDKQLKFLNEIVYTRNQSIQTIHMLAPKCSTYNGRPTFANPRYLKKAQSEKPCLYEIPYDTSDLANRFAPNREETMTLANESRSKLNKDYVKPYDYTKQNSLYKLFKAPSLEYLYQLERAKEVRKTMWRKPFVRTKPNIAKNIAFLPVSKSISKSRQVFNDLTFNINQFREIIDQAWFKHTSDYFRVPTAKDMEVLIKTLLMPLSIKTQNDSFCFEHELKTEMHEYYEYVKSLEKEVDEPESEKADFSNIYDLLLKDCVSKDVTCSYLHSLSDLNAYAELQCLYLHKFKECECLAQKL